jgi:hypothetical protein
MGLYRYSATVNGKRRSVMFHAKPEDWGHEPIREDDGTVTPAELNLATAQLVIDSTYDLYKRFYAGATDADYDAEHVGALLEKQGWQIIEGDAS